jgi:hypothetical protein
MPIAGAAAGVEVPAVLGFAAVPDFVPDPTFGPPARSGGWLGVGRAVVLALTASPSPVGLPSRPSVPTDLAGAATSAMAIAALTVVEWAVACPVAVIGCAAIGLGAAMDGVATAAIPPVTMTAATSSFVRIFGGRTCLFTVTPLWVNASMTRLGLSTEGDYETG